MQAKRPNQDIETFPDGFINVYSVDKKKRQLTSKKGKLRFASQSVSYNRYYTSKTDVNTEQVDKMIKVMNVAGLKVDDIAEVGGSGDQFWIVRIQELPEKDCLLLELKTTVPKLLKAEGVL